MVDQVDSYEEQEEEKEEYPERIDTDASEQAKAVYQYVISQV